MKFIRKKIDYRGDPKGVRKYVNGKRTNDVRGAEDDFPGTNSLAGRLPTFAGKAVEKIQKNYGYLKAGVRATINEDPDRKALIEKNKLRVKNIKAGNPEENLKLDKYSKVYHKTRGAMYKATGGRMG